MIFAALLTTQTAVSITAQATTEYINTEYVTGYRIIKQTSKHETVSLGCSGSLRSNTLLATLGRHVEKLPRMVVSPVGKLINICLKKKNK